jgi:hypothetical protein
MLTIEGSNSDLWMPFLLLAANKKIDAVAFWRKRASTSIDWLSSIPRRMSLAKNPRPQHRCTTDFALSGKSGGKCLKKQCLSEHRIWITLSLLSRTSQAIGIPLWFCSIFRPRVDCVDHTQADKVALGARPPLPLRGNLLP